MKPKAEQRLAHLDMVRGLAALAVCAGHLRAMQLVNSGDVRAWSFVNKGFYFLTGLGHQAVMVFFVLSGYFVAGSVVDSWTAGRWSWSHYALRRLARLWTVLLPALVLTLILDSVGAKVTQGSGYDGGYKGLLPGLPSLEQPAQYSFAIFLGNTAFLQTISVPAYGTNGPLWSLANEFWYYVLFPLLWVAARGAGATRLLAILLGGILLIWLPVGLLLRGIVWLFGFIVYLVCRAPALKEAIAHPFWRGLAGLAFMGSLVASKYCSPLGSDYLVGGTFALLVPGLVASPLAATWYRRIATALADISYTLYVVHFPLLALFAFVFFMPVRQQPDFGAYARYGVILTGVLLYAGAVWWVFERNTTRIRLYLENCCFGKERKKWLPHSPTTKRVAWVGHSPTPYKTPFFRALAAAPGVDVTFFFLFWDDPQRPWKEEALPGVQYKVLPGLCWRRSPTDQDPVHCGPAVVGELWRGHFDLIVLCGYNHPTLLLTLFYCLVSGRPFVLQGESHVVQQRHPLKKAIKRWLLFPLLRRAKAAFATGRMAADYWADVGIPREKIFIVSNTPDVEFFVSNSDRARTKRHEARTALGLDNRRIGIFVGRFVAAKGVETLLKAAALLPPESRPQLFLVGDGPLKADYEEIIKAHNLPVRIVGFQQKVQLPELYAAADFFVLPSLSEPWGVVVNEAMACGLPVLLSDQVGAAYDLLQEGRNGFMIPAGNVEAWRKGLERIMNLSEADLTRMGAASRAIVRPWNHEANVKNVLECVKMVCGGERKVESRKQK